MSELKMSDVFNLPLKTEKWIVHSDPYNVKWLLEKQIDELECGSKKEAEYVSHAINNHDRLVEENQLLTDDRNNAISLMSPSWKHAASKDPDLMTRYVTMAENQFKRKDEEIERLNAIATKYATRCDELYEALECICSYVSEDGLITAGLAKEIVNAQRLLNKSRTEADK